MKNTFADDCLERSEMALKYQSWGNAAPILRTDVPELARRLNWAIGTIAALLETSECREDEDCDHCAALQAMDELEAMPEGGDEPY